MELSNLFTIFHLLGVALGVGGAIASDSMFLKALKDLKISRTEIGFLQIGNYHIERTLPSYDEFMRKRLFLFTSGAVSLVSWLSALVLGALHKVPWSYVEIMGVYFAVLALAAIGTNLIGRRLIS